MKHLIILTLLFLVSMPLHAVAIDGMASGLFDWLVNYSLHIVGVVIFLVIVIVGIRAIIKAL